MTKSPACMIDDYRLLRRMLGAEDSSTRKARAAWGSRNHLYAVPGTEEHESLVRLQAAGFVVDTGQSSFDGTATLWRCTIKGCQWVGLSDSQTRKAMEGTNL